jgi:urease gamma subunit
MEASEPRTEIDELFDVVHGLTLACFALSTLVVDELKVDRAKVLERFRQAADFAASGSVPNSAEVLEVIADLIAESSRNGMSFGEFMDVATSLSALRPRRRRESEGE